ncbi:MAG TPA: hypothetical protein VF007_04830 [Stellaceae bacterium]
MTETITLGGREFQLRPLKLGQLREVVDALERMSGKTGGALIAAAAEIVAAGLAPAHPEIDPPAVLDLEASLDELNGAVAAVLRLAGLQPQGDMPGEARPVATETAVPGESSAGFTPPSPPAAVTPIVRSTG